MSNETPRTDAFAAGEVNKGSAMAYVRAVDLCRELERENAKLSALVEQLQANDRRYRFLRENVSPTYDDGVAVQLVMFDTLNASNAEELVDAAIDRAMSPVSTDGE